MAKGSSFGGTVKLNGEDEYKKALRDITSNLKLVSSELKLTNTEFSNGDKNIKQAKTSYDSMKNTLQSQKDKVKELKEALSKMEKEYGSNNETVRLFKTQLNNAENQLKQMEDATDKSNKELKEMKKGFEDAGDGALKFSDVLKANVLGDVIVGGLKKIGSATLEIGKAFLDVGKQALDSYANYEQLVGGVETLFKDSANIVEDYANNAYKNAGLSANDYMETVTSFSASLLQSLNNDTAKSAEVADMAITDMSDNANKMGTDMSMIQNAYQGFAKQNYTMLDNLKLGYGGTKSEMERLLADAEKISGIKYDISSFADITQAIHVMQEEMGITGTTAKEAGTTIEGSVNSMKSAWQNLLTDLANGGKNMGSLIENLMTTIFGDGTETNLGVFGNVLPVIQNIVSSFADVIPNIVDKLMEHLPYLLDAASEIIMSLVYGITENIPALMPVISDLFGNILQYIIESLPIIINSGVQIILALVQGIGESLPTLIPALVDAVVLIVETLIDNIDLIIDAGIQLILGLADGLIEALPRLIDKVPEIIEKLFDAFIRNFPKIVEAGGQLIGKLIVGIIGSLGTLYSRVPEIIHTVVKGISSGYQTIKNAGLNLVAGIWEGISGSLDWIKNKIKGWVGNVTKFIKNLFGIHSPSKLFKDEIGTNLALGIGEGFTDTMTDVQQEMADAIPTKFDTTINSKIGNNSYQNVANSGSFDNMVIAFKTALKDVKVIMDEKEMGTFVTNAVEEVVYS
jgi:phage-related protein